MRKMPEVTELLKKLKKRVRRWWNGPANVVPMDLIPYLLEKELHQMSDLGKESDVSMELLDSYITFRQEGYAPEEAQQMALREWDL